MKHVQQPPRAQAGKLAPGGVFAPAVAGDAAPQLALYDRPPRARAPHQRPLVFKAHLARQPLMLPANSPRRVQRQMRYGHRRHLGQAQLDRQLESRKLRHIEQAVDQFVPLVERHINGPLGTQQLDPAEGAEILQSGDTLSCHDQAPWQHQSRILDGQRLVGTHEVACQPPFVAGCVRFHFDAQFPGRTLVPFQRFRLLVFVAQDDGAARCAHQRQQDLGQTVRQAIAVGAGLRIGLRHRPTDALGRPTRQIRQNPAVVVPLNIVELAGTQFQRLAFAPLAVRAALPL